MVKSVGYLFWQGNIEEEKTPEAVMYSSFFSNYIFLVEHGNQYQLYSTHQIKPHDSLSTVTKTSSETPLTQLSKKNITAADFIQLLRKQYLLGGHQHIMLVCSEPMPTLLRQSLSEQQFKIIRVTPSHDFMGSYGVTHILSPESCKIEKINTPQINSISIPKNSYLYRIWMPEDLVLNKS